MPTTRLILGPQGSHRSARIDALAVEHWGRFRLIVPSRAAARARAEALTRHAGKPGLWGEPVCDFHGFVESILRCEGLPVRRLATFERRLLLEQCLARLDDHAISQAFSGALDSPGIAAHLLRAISDLKQAAIEPGEFRNRIGGDASPRDSLVAEVYAAYQDGVLASGAYDVPGLYWRADLIARDTRPKALASVDALLFDGFDDFTPSEFRLVEALAPHVPELAFGLNHDTRPARSDLYAVPARTARHVRATFDPVEIECEAPAVISCRGHAAEHLAWRDAPPDADDLEADLALVPCVDDSHEVERVGRVIKRLIAEEAVEPTKVAVVFRKDDGVAGMLRRVFGEFGIPVRFVTAPPLVESGLARAWLGYFEAVAEWEREAVVNLISSHSFQFEGLGPEARDAASHLARRAQIVGGLADWRRGLKTLAERIERGRGEDIKALLARIPNAAQCIEALSSVIELLAETQLPSRATHAAHAAQLSSMIERWCAGIATADAEDMAALSALNELLNGFVTSATETIDRDTFLRHFDQGLRDTAYAPPVARNGVTVMDAESIRNLEFDYVYYLGVNENVVPAPPRASAVWPERDRLRLREAGIPLEGALEHTEHELLLFHHVLTAARRRVEISWHLQKDGGREAAHSPYVAELRELFSGRDDVLHRPPAADAFLPPAGSIASPRDLRVAALNTAPSLMKAFPGDFEAVAAGLHCEAARHDNQPPGVYDGVTGDRALRELVASAFGPSHCFSVSQLEHYVSCPFRYFQEYVLQIDDTEAPEDAFDNRIRGTILHEALQRFHARYVGSAVAEIPEDEARGALHAALAAAFEGHEWKCRSAPRGVRAVELRRMRQMLDRYLDLEREKGHPDYKPTHFEAAFGPARGDEPAGLSNPKPFVIETEAGPVALAGRIDRIDVTGNNVQIIDYKSGGVPSSTDIKKGCDLQLSVYAKAITQHLLPDKLCGAAWYVGLGKGKRQEALMLAREKDAATREENAAKAIEGAVRGIRAGRFPPRRIDPKKCYGCGNAHACRYTEARMARKPL